MKDSLVSNAEGFQKWKKVSSAARKVFRNGKKFRQRRRRLSEMEKSLVSGAEGFQKWKKASSAAQKVFRNGKKFRQRRRRLSKMEKSLVSGAESKEIVIFNQYQHEGS
jgi:alkyl hydroperoxide reductase subunit AhpF